MLYLKINAHRAVIGMATEFPDELKQPGGIHAFSHDYSAGRRGLRTFNPEGGWLNRNDIESMAEAEEFAAAATAFAGESYLATDAGPQQSPRYEVIRAPAVGDHVSYTFNGDTYPCGVIAKISPSLIVTTDGGEKFYRQRKTGGWKKQGGTWWMVHGHISEQNPHF